VEHYKLFINGEFADAADGKTFEAIDPGTEAPIATVAQAGRADAEAAIAAARKAFDSGIWSGLTPTERLTTMQNLADRIAQQGLRLAATESMNAGQVLALARLMPLISITFVRNLSLAAATKFPWEEDLPVSGNAFAPAREFIRREPVGVCVGIVPWNFPMYIALWKIVPALITGNTIIVKPSSVTPLSALILAEAAKAAGFPDGVINVIAGPGPELGDVLCRHPDVDKIGFTGSTETGRRIMRMAADTVKKVTLELGGKSATVILDDADMDLALEGACFGTFFNQGEVCTAGSRVLVASAIYEEFLDKMKRRVESLRIGYQMDPTSHIGPLVSKQQLAKVERYVNIGKDEGAELVTGGKRVEVPGLKGGYYYAPTIFTNVDNKMRIAQEEIFGPVACLMKFDSDEEAVAIANDSIYGLAGGVFSSNTARAERVARGVRTGTMWINNYHIFADFCPFGGYKQSGMGREFGLESLNEYTQVKRIHVNSMADAKSNMHFQILSDYKKVDGFGYNCPTNVIAGHGALASISKAVVDLGCHRALIITDPGVNAAGLAQLVRDALADFCVGIYDNITGEPDLDTVDAAAAIAREQKADCIVSVGGGSVIDTAKGVCVTLKNGGKANDYLNFLVLTEPQTPHIAIPTTAGTGSEVTNIAVLTSNVAARKLYIVDTRIMPNVAILDPRFTMSMPRDLTVSTAMDAMTHAVEAMMSTMANKICDGMALQAIRLINENLPLVLADGKNEKARIDMQLAATMAGWSFTIVQVALAHAMAHTVGVMYHVPHGVACGILLPKVMRYNVDYVADKLAQVARALGVDAAGMTEHDAAMAAADAVEDLLKKVGHPMKLRDIGVPEEGLPLCAFHAIADTAALFNGRPVTDPNEVLQIYRQAY
jgi:aldehyde dehydrogenase (NAD+)